MTQNAQHCTQNPKLDDAKGKRCECGGPLVALRSVDLRICNDCKAETPWKLAEGQKPLIGSNRSDRK